MWLHEGDQTRGAPPSCGRHRHGHLRRRMTVVVVERHPPDRSSELESPMDAPEPRERGRPPFGLDPHEPSHLDRGRRVVQVVHAVDRQLDGDRWSCVDTERPTRPRGAELFHGHRHIAVRTTVRTRPHGGRGERTGGSGIVARRHHLFAAARERGERFDELIETTRVEIDMVELDVRDDPDRWFGEKEGTVALVGLEHEQVAFAMPRSAPTLVEVAAHQVAGIRPASLKTLRSSTWWSSSHVCLRQRSTADRRRARRAPASAPTPSPCARAARSSGFV